MTPDYPNTKLGTETIELVDELNDTFRNYLEKDLKKAEEIAVKAETIAKNIHYDQGLAEASRNRGKVYQMQNKTGDAFTFFKEAYSRYKKLNYTKGIAMSLNDLGAVYLKISDYPRASKYFYESLRIKESLNDRTGVAKTLLNLGSVYQKQNNYKKAHQMYQQSLRIAEKLKDTGLIATNLQNKGEVLIAQKKYRQALNQLNKAAELSLKINERIRLASIYNNSGSAWLYLMNFVEAEKAFRESMLISREEKLNQEFYSASLNLASIFIRSGDFIQAEKMLRHILHNCKKGEDKFTLAQTYEGFSDMYLLKKDYKKSIFYFKRYHQLRTSLLNEENIRQTNELNVKYDAERKEKESEIYRLKNVELKEAMKSLDAEKKRSDSLLKNILPDEVAEDLKAKGKSPAKYFESVSVLFADIKDFTVLSMILPPEELVQELDLYFRKFDEIIAKHGIEKIKTIGDAYLCVCGLPKIKRGHALKMVYAAREMLDYMAGWKSDRQMLNKPAFEIRIGIHSGPVIAGIVGSRKFAYDIWGDTVNTAARMEQNGETSRINISESTYQLVKRKFPCTYRGKIAAKNKGGIDMYFVND